MSGYHKPFPKVIEVDETRCTNCHACIAVCPVKICNDGSSDHVSVDPQTCIGCGQCLSVCSHNARYAVDDLDSFIAHAQEDTPLVAIIAPSIAASFPTNWKRVLTWLREQGVEAVFDVSFGAELATKSYVEHLRKEDSECMISSACPAVVGYVATYQPELLPLLAPYDSPMVHTLKMIRASYPQYRDHSTVIISPCFAKKRELEQAGLGDFNVTMSSLNTYFEANEINLADFEESDFDQPPAGQGVLFSSPGGLLQNMEQHLPGVTWQTRRIEGENVYKYLEQLPSSLKRGTAPLLIDCLSCSKGCNGGPGALAVDDQSLDELDHAVKSRRADNPKTMTDEELEERLKPYWNELRFRRIIRDHSEMVDYKPPTDDERDMTYQAMLKCGPEDILNCTGCGYRKCEDMAAAIVNGLNRPDNCYLYLQRKTQQEHEQMQQAQERFRIMFDSSHEAIILCDQHGVTDCNEAASKLFGISMQEMISKKILDFFPEFQPSGQRSQSIVETQIAKVDPAGRASFEWVMHKGDGSLFTADARINKLTMGDTPLLHLQVQDVSEQNRTRKILQESHDYIQALIESVECGILVIDACTHEIIDANSYALRLIKAPKETVIGRKCHSFVCPAEEGDCPAVNESRRMELQERTLLDTDGNMVPVLKTVVRAQLGERTCFIESFVDISTKKETELALKRAKDAAENANKAKSEFLANMSHEIRTPMNGVLGLADLLMDMNLANEEKELAKDIHYSAESLLRILNDVLDLSRIEAGELVLESVPFNLVDNVKATARVFRQLAKERGNRLVTRFSPDISGHYIGDPLRLRQVIVNLLGNSIKFTDDGQIDLSIERKDLPDGDCMLEVMVRDTGVGIPEEKLAVIFEKFSQADSSTTRKFGGTGLGLAITRELVDLMGGTISAESRKGEGTEIRFSVRLKPVEENAEEVISDMMPVTIQHDFSNVKVLLVEDNRVNQVVITKLLERLECQVVTAGNGQEALDKLEQEEFDIVFMDCSMPVMDGFEATRQIREAMELKDLPVIAVTAHAMQGDNRRCYNAGMNGYISKPVNRRALHKMLQDYFGAHVTLQPESEKGKERSGPSGNFEIDPKHNKRLPTDLLGDGPS